MFKIHKDAKRWSERLINKDGPIKTQFDIYYLSFIVGIGLGRTASFANSDVTEITKTVTDPYIQNRYILAGLLLVSELTAGGFKLNKKLVKEKVSKLIDSESQTFLNDHAIDLMNQFAYGGFEAIIEKFQGSRAPGEAHVFLIWYYNEMIPVCFQDETWVSN